MAGPLRPNPPPPPLELNGRLTFETLKKRLKKSSFLLNGPALYPPPLLIARPLRVELFFVASHTQQFFFINNIN